MTLSELSKFEQTIIQALRVAGQIYAQDASRCHREGAVRLENQFVSQTTEVFKLADRIEQEGISK